MRALVLMMVLSGSSALAAGEEGRPPNPFFALCHDTHDAKKRSLEQQAALLEELGYDGAGHLWLKGLAERLKTLDAHGLELFQVYVRVNIARGKRPYDPRLKEAVKLLEGRGTMLAVLVKGAKPSAVEADQRGVAVLREIADLAAQGGLRVAIYPHTNDWAETVEDALRVVRKADRENLGVMFNLCHWLKCGGETTELEPLLRDAMPHLFAVTINGADAGLGRRGGWDRLIQPLGSGTFDVHALLRILRTLGYTGPVGLQCYGLRGDARDHLARSMAAWKRLQERLAARP
ncbi:MAG: sugar phosphate isomerase/epimerase family protein [Planctomycetota bacterium]